MPPGRCRLPYGYPYWRATFSCTSTSIQSVVLVLVPIFKTYQCEYGYLKMSDNVRTIPTEIVLKYSECENDGTALYRC
eukprot:scaffold79417_cov18-Prasinocladus_malaysianus.AAC.1